MRGPSGAWLERPVQHSLSEGLPPHEFFLSASQGQVSLRCEADWGRRQRQLQRGLLGALGPVRVTQLDCGTRQGLTVGAEVSDPRVLVGLVPRLIGRTAATEVRSPGGEQVLLRAGEPIDAAKAARLERWGVYRVTVRSASTCEAEEGVCARCHGWEPSSARPVERGAAVGLPAARMLRTLVHPPEPVLFWVGSVTSLRWDPYALGAEVSVRGVVHHENLRTEPRQHEDERVLAMLNEEGRLSVRDDDGTELESFRVRRGDLLRCEEGQRVEPGSFLLRIPIPMPRSDELPLGDLDMDAKALEALLLARRPPADDRPFHADVDGSVRLVPIAGRPQRRTRTRLFLHPEAGGPPRVHRVSRDWTLTVLDGDPVHRGQQLVTGTTTLHEVLRFLGQEAATVRLVTHLERFFRRNQTAVHGTWLELLTRQMLGYVLIEEGGDTGLLPGQRVPWGRVRRLDAQALSRGGRGATWTPVFTGLHTLARDGGPLNGALFGDGLGSWTRAALSGQGEPSSSALLRILAGLAPR